MYKFTFVLEDVNHSFSKSESLSLVVIASSLNKARNDLRFMAADTRKFQALQAKYASKSISWKKVIRQICDIELIEPIIEKLNESGVK